MGRSKANKEDSGKELCMCEWHQEMRKHLAAVETEGETAGYSILLGLHGGGGDSLP